MRCSASSSHLHEARRCQASSIRATALRVQAPQRRPGNRRERLQLQRALQRVLARVGGSCGAAERRPQLCGRRRQPQPACVNYDRPASSPKMQMCTWATAPVVYCHAKQERPLDKLISSSRYWCLSRVRRCSRSKSTKRRCFWVLSCLLSVLPCSWLQYNLRTWSPTSGEQSCHIPDL